MTLCAEQRVYARQRAGTVIVQSKHHAIALLLYMERSTPPLYLVLLAFNA